MILLNKFNFFKFIIIFRINTTGSDVTMESKKLAAFYCKRMIPLSDEKSNINFSSSDSIGLGKIILYL